MPANSVHIPPATGSGASSTRGNRTPNVPTISTQEKARRNGPGHSQASLGNGEQPESPCLPHGIPGEGETPLESLSHIPVRTLDRTQHSDAPDLAASDTRRHFEGFIFIMSRTSACEAGGAGGLEPLGKPRWWNGPDSVVE